MSSIQSKSLEMGYTESEFRKTLIGQFTQNTSYTYTEFSKNHWLIYIEEKNEKVINTQISQALPRKIEMLVLPVLDVYFEFNQISAVEQKDFMNTFFRYFHKGGG